jgi:hypothetical protein
LFVSFVDLLRALDGPRVMDRFYEAFYGLLGEGLVSERFGFGPAESLAETDATTLWPGPGLVYCASRRGIGLFLWGHGKGQQFLTDLTATDQSFELIDPGVSIEFDPSGVALQSSLPKRQEQG